MDKIAPVVSTIIAQASEGIVIADEYGVVQCANNAVTELLGLPSDTELKSIDQLGPVDVAKAVQTVKNAKSKEDPSFSDRSFVSFDKRLRIGEDTRFLRFRTGVCQIPGGEKKFRAVLIQDCTSEKKLEAVFNFKKASGMVTDDAKMLEILAQLKHVAESNASVLLLGESGTGKTLLAHLIHDHSKRKKEKFVEVSCAAIPETLIESELFGHVKGAFTTAIDRRPGRFETAHKGTIFLDEISEIPLNLQGKLLKVLQDQQFEKVGSDESVQVDVRVISASNRNLRKAVDDGEFRPDLYYRIAVVPIHIPPLRERPSDVPLLIKHFYESLADRGYPADVGFSRDAVKLMMDYPWPGNVRELANAVEHGLICAENKVVTIDSLPQDIRYYERERNTSLDIAGDTTGDSSRADVARQKRELLGALEQAGGNRAQAAEILGIDRSTLWRWMKRHGIESS